MEVVSMVLLEMLAGVLLLLASTVAFVEGVEVLAGRLRLTRFAAGALLAAVLTAIPETAIAVLSYFQQGYHAAQVGMGSVLAAPSITLLVGAPVVAALWKSTSVDLGVAKNYVYFAVFMTLAAAISQLSLGPFINITALLFLLTYVYLARSIYVEEGEVVEVLGVSFVERLLRRRNTGLAALQVGLAAAGLPLGADLFIDVVSTTVNPFALALVVSPFATCLEEVFVAFYWMMRNKADIAISLLSGENLVQSTFVVGVGMAFTGWALPSTALGVVVVYVAAAVMLSLAIRLNRFRLGAAVLGLYPVYMLLASGFLS
ncbi:MAG: hypothetical protein NZ941_01745 [Candidatus Caldarchaeum sp.]|nr:hypothetical protein [Candidatus Caldarchaeum sp.]